MSQNAIAVYQPEHRRNKINELINYIKGQFEIFKMEFPDIREVKTALALMHDWACSGFGLRYMYEIKGIDITPLSDCIIHSDHNYSAQEWGEVESIDQPGCGFYLYIKSRKSDFFDRINKEPYLTRWEAKSISEWFEHLAQYQNGFRLPVLKTKELEIICWAYLMFTSSPMGNDFFTAIDVWGSKIKEYMDKHIIDMTGKPWKWNDNYCPDQIAGAVVSMDYCEVYNSCFEEMNYADGKDDFNCEEDWNNYKKLCETNEIILHPSEIIITGRHPSECRICGSNLKCVETIEKYTPPSNMNGCESYHEHRMCSRCVEQERQNGVKFENEDEMACYSNRCPAVFLKKMVETDMGVEIAAEVVRNGVKNYIWRPKEIPLKNDHFLDERIQMLIKEQPKKLRHMAAYVLMKNKCLAGHYSDSKDCGRINHRNVHQWFLSLKQQDYQERMLLGTYHGSAPRIT